MWAVFKKEISTYFASMVGYLAVGFFLALNALMFWVFPATSILENGYAQLDGFFQLTPYFLMFLIPAITMKSMAGERQQGTLDWLRTAPVSDAEIVLGKYLASFTIGCLAIAPTILYVFSIYFLSLPQGNIDLGSIIGSYFGLFFLLAAFTAIGTWASMQFDNPVVSFLSAVGLLFIFFYGFDAIGPRLTVDPINSMIRFLDMNHHYESQSRGVLDSRSVIYFVSVSILFLYFTKSKLKSTRTLKSKHTFKNGISLVIFLISLQIGGIAFHDRIDLTSDKRFTLSDLSKTSVHQLDDQLKIQVLLEGGIHPAFKRLEMSVNDFLKDLKSIRQKNIQIDWVDPLASDHLEDRNQILQQLADRGIQPLQVHIQEHNAQIQKLVFPYAILQMNGKEKIVNLLPAQQAESHEQTINQGIELLEYSFISAIRKLQSRTEYVTAFAQGHGEADPTILKDAAYTLAQGMQVAFVNIKEVPLEDLTKINLLILAKPTQSFSEETKFKLDYFVMNGGKLILAIDQLDGSLDSLKKTGTQTVLARELHLDDLFFTYGFRLNYDLIADLQAAQIPITGIHKNAVGQPLDLALWPFHPIVTATFDQHPAFSKMDPIKLQYVGTIDTVETEGLQKQYVLRSSVFNRVFVPPVPISLDLLTDLPAPEELHTESKPLALLIEGRFSSAFKLREKPLPPPDGMTYPEKSKETKIFVIGDGDVFSNEINRSDQSTYPLGWDPITRQTFANKTLLLNLADYMLDGPELISLRNKKIALRLLDKVALKNSEKFWQTLNVALPLIILGICAALHIGLRKRRWTSPPRSTR